LNVDGSTNTARAEVDAGGFKFVGGTPTTEPKFGVAALHYDATFKWDATTNGGQAVYKINGAWVELVFGFSGVFLYKERNGQKGFQYSLGNNVWEILGFCPSGNNYDCFKLDSYINFANDLNYSPLNQNINVQNCTDVFGNDKGYNASCKIYQLTAIGTMKLTGTEVLRITFTVASQKILLNPGVNQHVVGPDYSKIDLTITYPYTEKTPAATKTDYNIGVVVYASGKSGTASVEGGVKWNDKAAFAWRADSGKAAVIAWDGQAELTTSGQGKKSVDVFVEGLTGQTIINYDCATLCTDGVSKAIIGAWKTALNIYKDFGWTGQVIFLSWDQTGVDQVYYDPSLAVANDNDLKSESGVFLACSPTLFLSFLSIIVVHYFFTKQ